MKKVIRNGVFETNSSTCHSVIIMTEEQNKKWEKENLYYYSGSRYYNPFKELPEDKQPKAGSLYTKDEVLEFYKLIGYESEEIYDFISYEDWCNSEYLERDTNYYTTPGGEKIVVKCKYGYDG